MKIDVAIHGSHLTTEKKQEIQNSIEQVILHHQISLERPTAKLLTVSLSEEPGLENYSGSAVNELGEEAIKIEYQLSTGATILNYS